jgi:hypothetical protein
VGTISADVTSYWNFYSDPDQSHKTYFSPGYGIYTYYDTSVIGPAAATVPEPASLTLFGIGAVCIGAVCAMGNAWRQRKQMA